MAILAKHLWVVFVAIVIAAAITIAAYQFFYLQKAHSTFENYYAFRGCTQLVDRTDTEGRCVTNDGQTIKIVKFDNRWYLDGDLPCVGSWISCFGSF